MDHESEGWLLGAVAELVKRAANNSDLAVLRVGRAPAMIDYNRHLIKEDGQVTMAPNPNGAGGYGKIR